MAAAGGGGEGKAAGIDLKCINTVRALAADMVEEANSGHPGKFFAVRTSLARHLQDAHLGRSI